MPKLPQVSSDKLVKLLVSMGYRILRQRGSHIQLRKDMITGQHNVTVPAHDQLAKGTLNDILSVTSQRNGVPKEELVEKLRSN